MGIPSKPSGGHQSNNKIKTPKPPEIEQSLDMDSGSDEEEEIHMNE